MKNTRESVLKSGEKSRGKKSIHLHCQQEKDTRYHERHLPVTPDHDFFLLLTQTASVPVLILLLQFSNGHEKKKSSNVVVYETHVKEREYPLIMVILLLLFSKDRLLFFSLKYFKIDMQSKD